MSGYIGPAPVPQATQTRQAFTATSGQTTFNTAGYTPGYVDVYLNGVKLAAADYTATNGSDIVLAAGAAASDILEVVAFEIFQVADQDFTGDFSVDTDTLYVDSTNDRVGIGTTSPVRKLTVKGSNNTTNFEVTDGSGGSTFNVYNNTTSNAVALGTSSDSMSIGFNGLDKVFFKSDGNVGIGTNSPDTKLHVSDGHLRVAGTETSGSFLNMSASNTGSDGVTILASYYGSGSYGPIKLRTGGSERMRIDSSGNVGIGNSSPQKELHIGASDNTNHDAVVVLNNGGATGYRAGIEWRYEGNTTPRARISVNASNQILEFDTAGTERMRINSIGNVGIGTSSPATKVDINNGTSDSLLTLTTNSFGGAARTGINFQVNSFANTPSGQIALVGDNNYSGNMIFSTAFGGTTNSPVERMRISSSGTFALGSTNSNPYNWSGSSGAVSITAPSSNTWAQLSLQGNGSVGTGINLGSSGVRHAGIFSLNGSTLSFATNPTNSGISTREHLKIDSAGRVTMPYQPAFLVHSSGTNSIPTNAAATVVFNNKISDRGNHFNIGTYTYTVPVSGFYHFDATISYSGSFTAPRIIAYIVVNGSNSISRQTYRAGQDTGVSVSGSLYLSANDNVTVKTYQDSGVSRNLLAYLEWTHFSGYLIG